MEDPQTAPVQNGWDAVHLRNAGRRATPLRSKYRAWIGVASFVLVVAGIHACIAYFGWSWLRSMQAPETFQATAQPARQASRQEQPNPNVVHEEDLPMTTVATGPGTLRWTKREGMTLVPERKPEWKCAGGFYFTTSKGSDGSTVVTMVERGGRPIRCSG